MSSFQGLYETIAEQGLFRAFYTDRGSHYFFTPKAGGKVDKAKPTQVGRALPQLGITHIPSYSPEARGRMERAFGRLQNRLPPELRSPGSPRSRPPTATSSKSSCPTTTPDSPCPPPRRSAFIPYAGRPLGDILCIQDSRQVGRDKLRQLEGGLLADPAAAPSPPFRPGHRARAPIPRRPTRHLRWAELPRSVRPQRKVDRCLAGRLTPLGGRACGFVDNALRCPQIHRPINHRS